MMAAESRKKSLGRGLSALLGEDDAQSSEPTGSREPRRIPVELLKPGRYQPRQTVEDEPLQELAQSIRDKGVLQPLLVRRHPEEDGNFEIIAGERRWRAAQLAQVHEVPVIVKELDDREALEVGLIENLQREDLSPLDEAEGFRRLKEEFSYTQAALAASLGKSRSHVANTMRLLNLPAPIKDMIERGTLSAGHARALLNADEPLELARTVARRGLNVRQTEKLVQRENRPAKPRSTGKDSDTLALERDLSNLLGLKVGIRFKGGSGTLTIKYRSIEQLDDILHKLSQGAHGAPHDDGVDDADDAGGDGDGSPVWPAKTTAPQFETADPAKLEVDFSDPEMEDVEPANDERPGFDAAAEPDTIAGIPVAPPDDPTEDPL